MKPSFFTLTILLTIFVIFQACQAPPSEIQSGPEYSAAVKEIIESKNEFITEAYRNGNIEAAAAHFTDDCVQMPPNSAPMIGVADYTATWQQNASFGLWDLNLEVQEVRAVGNMAVELGSYTLTFTPNETSPIPPMEDEGNYLVAWEKVDGDWKILWDAPVSTVPLPMPDVAEAE